MLTLPVGLSAEQFLARYWQKAPLFVSQAAVPMRPSISRNELAWLATLEDVESRIVFTDRRGSHTRYRVETGPFDASFLSALPIRDWTLLVHDVEKHLPALRRLFSLVPFIPDWRIDDLMVSFAAPGGGVGPHRDNYDVFLCQGIGVREWRITRDDVALDADASDELVLTTEFAGDECVSARKGDVLYLPPGVAHWGTALRACITYSIGMRAPEDYADADLELAEVQPGYISTAAHARAGARSDDLGEIVTETKEWLRPVPPEEDEIRSVLASPGALSKLGLHGMARLAYDDGRVYLNGNSRKLDGDERFVIAALCRHRRLNHRTASKLGPDLGAWLLRYGAFALPEDA